MNIKHLLLISCLCCGTVVLLTSCNDFLDITPTGKVIAKTGEEYRSLLTYEYKYFPKDRYLTTVRTDEVTLTAKATSSTDQDAYLDLWRWKDDDPSVTTTYFNWRGYYHAIYIANYIIEHRGEIANATQQEVSQLVGEAYMMRAYCHFLLVNLYAEPYTHCTPASTRGVPIQVAADVNAMPRSSSVETVYAQVLSDLDQAAGLMNVRQWETGQNYRFNATSVDALRARTYLYMGRWQDALDAARKVIANHGDLEGLTAANALFPNSYKSVENIVALERFSTNEYTVVGMPNPDFMALYRSGDQRLTQYYKRATASRYTLLKGGSDELACSFRSSEAYLTAAEATCRLGQRAEAIQLLEPLLKHRLNAEAYDAAQTLMTTMTNDQLLQEILDERARELAFEGHRWYDLRRTTCPALQRQWEGQTYTLTPEHYTMRFPTEAVEANPEIEIWNN